MRAFGGIMPLGRTRDLPVPGQGASAHARGCDHGEPGGRSHNASDRIAFRAVHGVGTRGKVTFAAQWLAYALPCRRFAPALADSDARLGADVDRYSFIAADLHHLLLAGLPALGQFTFCRSRVLTSAISLLAAKSKLSPGT